MPDIKTLKKFGIVGWAIMECMFFAGLLYGWPSLNFVLKSEGIYADLCEEFSDDSHSRNDSVVVNNISSAGTAPTTNTTYKLTSDIPTQSIQKVCKEQDDRMFMCFMIGIVAFGVGCLIFGLIILKLKTRKSRCISCIIFMTGTVSMAFIGQAPCLMFIGLPLMTIGGTPVFMTNIQVSNLFPSSSSTIVGLLCGAFDLSSGVMLLVKVAHDNGFDRKYMFIIITVLHLMILVSTMMFLQDDPVQAQNNQEQESLISYLKKREFQLHVIWLSILQLRFFYYLGTLNSYLNRIFDDDEKEVSKWTNCCQYIMLFGILYSPVAGLIYDKIKKCYNQDADSEWEYKKLMPAVVPLSVASILSFLLSVLAFFPVESVLCASFIVLTLHRSFLYSIAAGFISEIYPETHFGILFGIMMVAGGFANVLFYPLSVWSEQNSASPQHVNGLLLGTVVLSFTYPIYLFMRARPKTRNASQCNFEEVPMNPDLS